MSRRRFVLLCALAIAVRLALVLTTYGTNDAGFMSVRAALGQGAGIAHAYSHSAMMNHPPAGFALIVMAGRIAAASGIAFTDVLRAFQVIADVICAIALYQIGLRSGGTDLARRLALFVLLSPGAAFISAFHCNTDATIIAFVLVAAALVFADRDAAAGGALALAAGIKIPPLLLFPIFAAGVRRRRPFVIAFAIGGPVVVRVIFGYRGGRPYEWGVTGVAFAISQFYRPARGAIVLWQKIGWVEYAAIVAVLVLVWLRRPLTPAAILRMCDVDDRLRCARGLDRPLQTNDAARNSTLKSVSRPPAIARQRFNSRPVLR